MRRDPTDRGVLAIKLFVLGLLLVVLIGNGRELLLEGKSLQAALFAVLMAAHMALHWIPDRIETERGRWVYMVAQGLFALALSTFLSGFGYILALFAPLVGEAIGYMGSRRSGVAAAVMQMVIALAALFIAEGMDGPSRFVAQVLPTLAFVGVLVVIYRGQVEEREKAQALADELARANERLEVYASEVEDLTTLAERQRIARELHDTLAQGVAGLVLQLEAAKEHIAGGDGQRAAEIIDGSLGRARAALADSRTAIDALRKAGAPGSQGLAWVGEAVERFEEGSSVDVTCTIDDELQGARLTVSVAAHAQRILAEALANVARHAEASRVDVRLTPVPGGFMLEIEDDGVGFDPTKQDQSGRYGVLGMKERAELVGGRVAVTASPGRGTLVVAELPLVSQPPAEEV